MVEGRIVFPMQTHTVHWNEEYFIRTEKLGKSVDDISRMI